MNNKTWLLKLISEKKNDEKIILPSEALYAFAGFLTTIENSISIGAKENAAIVADLVDKFCKQQG